MRFSHEHTPPFVSYDRPTPRAQAMSEVYDVTPAVLAWVKDEAGEDHFMRLLIAALKRDMREMDAARDAIVDIWQTVDQEWIAARRLK